MVGDKLRGCDLVKIKIGTLVTGQEIRSHAMVVQQKTGRPVQFEITTEVRASQLAWLERRGGTVDDYALPRRVDHAANGAARHTSMFSCLHIELAATRAHIGRCTYHGPPPEADI